MEKKIDKENPLILRAYECYGLCLKIEGEYSRALKAFQKVSKIRQLIRGFGNRNTIDCNRQVAHLLFKLDRKS